MKYEESVSDYIDNDNRKLKNGENKKMKESNNDKVREIQKLEDVQISPKEIQRANTLFHFMQKFEYLTKALDRKALFPRYCIEDIDYLGLININTNKPINQIAVLQKCFCDIHLHNLLQKFPLEIVEADKEKIKLEYREKLEKENTHVGLYGKFGIAFSKKWCMENNLQPIHYVNEQSTIITQLKKAFEYISGLEDVDEVLVDDMLNRLTLVKSLSGTMERMYGMIPIRIHKNFHDECEWRYIPNSAIVQDYKLSTVIFGERVQKDKIKINSSLEEETYSNLWLKYNYDDIRYLIVPNNLTRDELIEYIWKLPDENFKDIIKYDETDMKVLKQKLLLISKILVIDDIEKDW